MIQAKAISALELLEHYLERVEQFNPNLNAVMCSTSNAPARVPKKPTRPWRRARFGARFTACR